MELEDLLEMLNVIGSNVEIIDAAVLAYNEAKQIMSEQNKPYKIIQDQAKERIGLIIKQTGQKNWNDEESLWDFYEPTNRERRQTNNRNVMVVQGKKLFNLDRLQRERVQRIKQDMV